MNLTPEQASELNRKLATALAEARAGQQRLDAILREECNLANERSALHKVQEQYRKDVEELLVKLTYNRLEVKFRG